jgi:hypothetical protein
MFVYFDCCKFNKKHRYDTTEADIIVSCIPLNLYYIEIVSCTVKDGNETCDRIRRCIQTFPD